MKEENFAYLQKALLKPDAKKSSLWNKIGICYMHGHGVEKNLKLAFGAFKKATEFETVKSDAWLNLAHCHETAQGTIVNQRRAFACVQQALQVDPKNARAWNKLGLYHLYAIGTYQSETAAIKAFLEAVKHQPLYSNAWVNLGTCYKNAIGTRCRTIWAEICFRNARAIEPKNEMSWRQLAFQALEYGTYDSALRRFTIAREIAKNTPDSNIAGYDEYIDATKAKKEHDDYLPLYRIALQPHPIQFLGMQQSYLKIGNQYTTDLGERPNILSSNGTQSRSFIL